MSEVQQLTRDYRPADFNEVAGQEEAKAIMLGRFKRGKVAPAMLISGPYGTGKTTFARIIAKHICCLNYDKKELKPCGECRSCKAFGKANNVDRHISVQEINAADKNGVDDVRQLINNSKVKPLGKYRVFILDEIHKYSNSAQNALLKSLEEPPEQTVFIICTTEPHRLIPTVLSRLNFRLNLSEVSPEDTAKRLRRICKKEEVKLDKEVILKIAEASNGHVRDAIGILESAIDALESGKKLTVDNIQNFIENTSVANPFKVAASYLTGIYNGSYSSVTSLKGLDDQGLNVLMTMALPELHTEAMYAAINYKELACKTKDFWKFKEITSNVSKIVSGMDKADKKKFMAIMADMSDNMLTMVERLKNYGVHNPKVVAVSFTVKQAKFFKAMQK